MINFIAHAFLWLGASAHLLVGGALAVDAKNPEADWGAKACAGALIMFLLGDFLFAISAALFMSQ
jgi:hypothetical protein